VLVVAGVIGTVLTQLPAFSLHDPQAYLEQMDRIHAQYDSLSILGLNIGPQFVDVAERLGLFRVFSSPWFIFLLTLLVVSIVCCTLDRTPELWRTAHNIRLVQPAPFFDLRLNERARFTNVDPAAAEELVAVLRGRHFKVREQSVDPPDDSLDANHPVRHLYGDRNQYMKLTTLLTHLGLILFLAGGAVTVALGYETVVFLGEGQTAPVHNVGTPDNLLIKNVHFEAPTRPDGSFADFRTDLAIYRNGQEVARKIIRVNDPLEVDGYVFHQNTFGPAEQIAIHDPSGALVWNGPILLDGELGGHPQGFITIPGSDLGLLLVLDKTADNIPVLAVTGLGPTANPDESNIVFLRGLGLGESSDPQTTAGYSISWQQAAAYTGMVIKRDPGQGLIWIAYLSLITGLVLTFYFPRRRLWARLHGDHLELAFIGDRYVNAEREFRAVLDDLSVRLGARPELRPTH